MGIKINKLTTNIPVYDITVEKNHNFFANDILVHNCIEIVQYSDPETTAQCILSSLVLQSFIKNGKFDFAKLIESTRIIVKSLNNLIDINEYSTVEARKGASEQRAIAIGVQGLADVFAILKLSFTSEEAKKLNKMIFETIYFAALTESNRLAKENGIVYKYFKGSPYEEGILQFDMWGLTKDDLLCGYDWDSLKDSIKTYGLANSLVTGAMPTASSAIIIGSNESFEPFTYNIYTRAGIGGEHIIINKYLVKELSERGYWIDEIRNEIIKNKGSIQNIPVLDDDIKERYRTVFEIPQKELLNMAADRGAFIDQSQSMNLYMSTPTIGKLTSSHFYAWKKGLKTGVYYLRTEAVDKKTTHLAIDTTENKTSNGDIDCFGCTA